MSELTDFVLEHYENQDMNHVDFRVEAYRLALLSRSHREAETGVAETALTPSTKSVRLDECPVGLFQSEGGTLCLKTEYGSNDGRLDCYIVDSGEFFWGATPQTIASQRAQLVYPVLVSPMPHASPQRETEGREITEEMVERALDASPYSSGVAVRHYFDTRKEDKAKIMRAALAAALSVQERT